MDTDRASSVPQTVANPAVQAEGNGGRPSSFNVDVPKPTMKPGVEPKPAREKINWENVRPSNREIVCGMVGLLLWVIIFGFGLFVPTQSLRDAVIATITDEGMKPTVPNTSSTALANTAQTKSPSADSKQVGTDKTANPETADKSASDVSDSTPKETPKNDLSNYQIIGFLIVATGAYTVSNLFLMCLVSAFLGCMAFRWSTPFVSIDPNTSESSPDVLEAQREVRRAYTLAVLRGFLLYVLAIAGYLLVIPENSLGQLGQGQYARLAGALSSLAFLVGYEPRSIARLLSFVFSAGEKKKPEMVPEAGGLPKV